MAAKDRYKIPSHLDVSYLDLEIALKTDDGLGVKPLPMKVVFSYVLSGILCFYIISRKFFAVASGFQKILFVILWIILTFVLFSSDKTKRMQIESVPTILQYFPKSYRNVYTRKHQKATAFYNIANIDDISDDGVVSFNDGTYGLFYRVVGSASVLLFDSDKNAIVDRVDNFFRKWHTDSEVIFITAKESQKIYRQLYHLQDVYNNLEVYDDDLKMLAEEQFDILKNYVGDSFKSIHQYMIIKSENKETLLQAKNILLSECENSTMFFKQCVTLYKDDIQEMLKSVYKGV